VGGTRALKPSPALDILVVPDVLTSAGIDMALRVVARYHGEAVARNTARNMEYRYPDDNSRRV
jgi:hypothetical protein